MPLTLTFFALDMDDTEQVLRQTKIPDEALTVYISAPEIALRAAQTASSNLKPDGYRVTDDAGRVKASFTDGRRVRA